jgi:hypothetical protein
MQGERRKSPRKLAFFVRARLQGISAKIEVLKATGFSPHISPNHQCAHYTSRKN